MSGPPETPFAAVFFDCDSTLSAIEGVDELLDFAAPELRQEIATLTDRAMDGTLPLAEVYQTRLRLLAPREEQLTRIGELYCQHVTPDARGVIAALQFLGKHTGIVSGGLLPPVLAFARFLGIEPTAVHAVPVEFDADGGYREFDRRSPLWRNGGKIEVLRSLPRDHRPLLFVGDGATDLEVQGTAADRFVGYGGVKSRARVREAAEAWFDTASLAPLLRLALTREELQHLAEQPAFAPLLSVAGA